MNLDFIFGSYFSGALFFINLFINILIAFYLAISLLRIDVQGHLYYIACLAGFGRLLFIFNKYM